MVDEGAVPELFFLFFGLLSGAFVTFFLSRFPSVAPPYTVVIFILGGIYGIIGKTDTSDSFFGKGVHAWARIRPELILYLFIPALLFAEVTNLNLYHVQGSILQAVWLAGPGALLGTVLLAYCVFGGCLPIPVGWSLNVCFIFSSILSATDPVAVVQLLNQSKGGSERLKYMIIGEALLNDATALVLFNIFMPMETIDSESTAKLDVFLYFLKLIFVSPIAGVVMGVAAVFATNMASRHYKEDDHAIQIAIPLCCAYLSFIIGEHLLKVSGILCCCSAG